MNLKTLSNFGLTLRGLLVGKDFLGRHGGLKGSFARCYPCCHVMKAFVFCETVGSEIGQEQSHHEPRQHSA